MKHASPNREISLNEQSEIANYVDKARLRGYADKRILKSLSSAGWPENIVLSIMQECDSKPGNSIIKCVNLTKRFGDNVVLDSISLEIPEGGIFGIIGLSGSGKTTLLNSMIGFLQPDEGEVFFHKPRSSEYLSVSERLMDVKRLFGFATQEPSFYNKLTTEENLDHFGSLYNLPTNVRKANVSLLLELMGLTESKNTLAENLSGGMQRRLGIACSLIHDPKILILDEPTADLDPLLRREMWNLISKINQQGTTVILSSHFLSEIEELCTNVAILHNRKIVDVGTPNELRKKLSTNEEIHLRTASANYEKLIRELQKENLFIEQLIEKDHKLVIVTPHAERILHALIHVVERNKESIVDLDVVDKPSLFEVFEHLVMNSH
ncbi:MAG: ABC transporter ATP-binding protein [Candidatus Woesearchaeota archaeon]